MISNINNQKIGLKEFKIDEDVKQVLFGSLLGDGYLERGAKNASYRGCHCIKQKDYLLWKVNILSKSFRVNTRLCNNGLKYKIYKFNTNYSPILTILHNLYYIKSNKPKRRWEKIVNLIVLEELKPLGLAVWYCDDGTYCVRDGSCALSTQGFTREENLIIKEYFYNKWSITTTVIRDDRRHIQKTYYKLVFNKPEAEKFLNLIKDFIPGCMSYKLGHISEKNKELMENEDKRYKLIRKKEYYNNRDKNLARVARYRENHRGFINKKRVVYYWNNLEESRHMGKETMRKRRLFNREGVNLINYNYYHRYKERINKERRERLLNDPEYREKRNKKQREGYHKRKLLKVNQNGIIP